MFSGGTVSIEDGAKAKEEFAPNRKVRVDLNFVVPEGGDGQVMLDAVALAADNKLRELLERPTIAAVALPVPTIAPAKPAAAVKPKKADAPKPVEKTKDDLAREAGLPANDIVSKGGIDESEVAKEPEDDLGDILGEAAPAPITDAELGKAAQEKNAKMKAELGEQWAPAKIRDLIAEYAGAGKRINDIAADKRPAFLEKLKGLK